MDELHSGNRTQEPEIVDHYSDDLRERPIQLYAGIHAAISVLPALAAAAYVALQPVAVLGMPALIAAPLLFGLIVAGSAAIGAAFGVLRHAISRPLYNAIRDNLIKGGNASDHPIRDRYADDLKKHPIKTNFAMAMAGEATTTLTMYVVLGFLGLSPAIVLGSVGLQIGAAVIGGLLAGGLYKFVGRPIYNSIRSGSKKQSTTPNFIKTPLAPASA